MKGIPKEKFDLKVSAVWEDNPFLNYVSDELGEEVLALDHELRIPA